MSKLKTSQLVFDFIKAISDPNRVKILHLLASQKMCVCDIYQALDLPQNLVSHHLKFLKQTGLVSSCKIGRNVYYCQKTEQIQLGLTNLEGYFISDQVKNYSASTNC